MQLKNKMLLLILSVVMALSALSPAIADNKVTTHSAPAIKKISYNFMLAAPTATLFYTKTEGTLTLTHVSSDVIAMSEQPAHFTQIINIEKFIKIWQMQTPDSFAHDNPNAALVMLDTKKSVPVTLKDAHLDKAGNLTFSVKVLSAHDTNSDSNFKHVVLFVDGFGGGANCFTRNSSCFVIG